MFSKLFISENSFNNTISVSSGLDPDQDRIYIGPDLGSNCLKRLSEDNKSRSLKVKGSAVAQW